MFADKLREERKNKQLTLEEVSEATGVNIMYLQAIEEEDLSKLPALVYTKGFLRLYARFLNVDADEVVARYLEEKDGVVRSADKKSGTLQDNKITTDKEKTNKQTFGSSFSAQIERSRKRQRNVIIVIVVFIIFGFGLGTYYVESDKQTEKVDKAVTVQKNKLKNEVTRKASKPPKDEKIEGVVVKADFSDDFLLSVSIDGKIDYEGIVEAGKSLKWNGKDSVKVIAGNAGAVSLQVNNEVIGTLGKKGAVVEKTFSKGND